MMVAEKPLFFASHMAKNGSGIAKRNSMAEFPRYMYIISDMSLVCSSAVCGLHPVVEMR